MRASAPAGSCGVVSEGLVRTSKAGAPFDLRVSPGAAKNSVEGVYGEGVIRLKISAPPVDGKANSETESFLAELLEVSRSRVSVVKGASSRDKTELVQGAEPEKIQKSPTKLLR